MHVVLTCNFSPWSGYSGGGQRSTHMLACALSARGQRVSVVYTKPPWERIALPQLPYHVHWAALPALRSRREAALRPLSAAPVALVLHALSRRQRIDVVHAQGEEAALVPAQLGCPLVLTPRYPHYPALMKEAQGSLRARARLWVTAPKLAALVHTAHRAALVATTSHFSEAAVAEALAVERARLRVVPNGIDPAFFAVERSPQAAAGPIVFFGRLEHDKGVDVLVEALSTSRQRGRAVQIVGQGAAGDALKRKIARTGMGDFVQLIPWESPAALCQRLSRAALAVLPSRHESFGNAMAEALAAGTPLVSTNAGSLPELVEHGRTGWLVPPGDAVALRDAIDALLCDPARAEAMAQRGREAVRSRCGWDAVAASYLDVYEQARQLGPRGLK